MPENISEVAPVTELSGPLAKMKLIVQDTAGNDYYAQFSKDDFEVYPDMRTVEVYSNVTKENKRFIKKFLAIKEILQIEKKKDEKPKRVYEKKTKKA